MIEASCVCGAVRFEIVQAPSEVTACNCSACRRLGALWAYYPASEVRIVEGAGTTVGYARGDRCIAFHHCPTCGCTTHWESLDPADARTAVNARLMAPEVVEAARVRRLDGAVTWTYPDEV